MLIFVNNNNNDNDSFIHYRFSFTRNIILNDLIISKKWIKIISFKYKQQKFNDKNGKCKKHFQRDVSRNLLQRPKLVWNHENKKAYNIFKLKIK